MLGISIVVELLIYQGLLGLSFTVGSKHTLHKYLKTHATKAWLCHCCVGPQFMTFAMQSITSFIKQTQAACGTNGANIWRFLWPQKCKKACSICSKGPQMQCVGQAFEFVYLSRVCLWLNVNVMLFLNCLLSLFATKKVLERMDLPLKKLSLVCISNIMLIVAAIISVISFMNFIYRPCTYGTFCCLDIPSWKAIYVKYKIFTHAWSVSSWTSLFQLRHLLTSD